MDGGLSKFSGAIRYNFRSSAQRTPPPGPRGALAVFRGCAVIVPVVWPISRLACMVSANPANYGTRLILWLGN